MEEQKTQPKRRLLLPPPHRPWLRIIVLIVVVGGAAALVWFFVVRGILAVSQPQIPTTDDIDRYGARIIVRLEQDQTIATIVLNSNGAGTYYFGEFAEEDPAEGFGDLTIEASIVRRLAFLWFLNGFFDLPQTLGNAEGLSIKAFLAVGPFSHLVSCAGACPLNLTIMARTVWEELPEEVLAELPSFIAEQLNN